MREDDAIRTLHHYKTAQDLNNKQNNDIIYTAFAKAFDKCRHGVTAHQMNKMRITGREGRWNYNFLKDHNTFVNEAIFGVMAKPCLAVN